MKLTKVVLTDLLSHVSSTIELGSTLTVLAGVSDSGKSGVMRGLLQLCCNRPSGIDLIRHGAGRGAASEVKLFGVDDDGKEFVVARRRSKSKNEYEVNGKPLLAFGADVPEEVAKILKLSEHAFQLQSEGNFLLSRTAGEVAKVMSGTVGLAQIEAAFTDVRKRKTENDTKLRIAESDVVREQEAVDKFSELDVAANLVRRADEASEEAQAWRNMCVAIDALAADLSMLPANQTADVENMAFAVTLLGEREKALALDFEEAREIDGFVVSLMTLPVGIDDDEFLAVNVKILELETLRTDISDLCDDIAAIEDLSVRPFAIPKPAQCVTADRALAEYGSACDATQALVDAVTAINDLLLASYGLGRDCGHEIEGTEIDNEVLRLAEESRYAVACDMNAISAAYSEGAGYARACACTAAEETLAVSDLEKYMAEHPVCPECGAEQEHWHVNK